MHTNTEFVVQNVRNLVICISEKAAASMRTAYLVLALIGVRQTKYEMFSKNLTTQFVTCEKIEIIISSVRL